MVSGWFAVLTLTIAVYMDHCHAFAFIKASNKTDGFGAQLQVK